MWSFTEYTCSCTHAASNAVTTWWSLFETVPVCFEKVDSLHRFPFNAWFSYLKRILCFGIVNRVYAFPSKLNSYWNAANACCVSLYDSAIGNGGACALGETLRENDTLESIRWILCSRLYASEFGGSGDAGAGHALDHACVVTLCHANPDWVYDSHCALHTTTLGGWLNVVALEKLSDPLFFHQSSQKRHHDEGCSGVSKSTGTKHLRWDTRVRWWRPLMVEHTTSATELSHAWLSIDEAKTSCCMRVCPVEIFKSLH